MSSYTFRLSTGLLDAAREKARPHRLDAVLCKLLGGFVVGTIDPFSQAPHAAAFAAIGGNARAKRLTPAQRSAIARKAAAARWGPHNMIRKDEPETD